VKPSEATLRAEQQVAAQQRAAQSLRVLSNHRGNYATLVGSYVSALGSWPQDFRSWR